MRICAIVCGTKSSAFRTDSRDDAIVNNDFSDVMRTNLDEKIFTAYLGQGFGHKAKRRKAGKQSQQKRHSHCQAFHGAHGTESASKISSTARWNRRDILNASGKLGAYFPASSATTVWRAMPSSSASCACERSRSTRKSLIRFFIGSAASGPMRRLARRS